MQFLGKNVPGRKNSMQDKGRIVRTSVFKEVQGDPAAWVEGA